MHRYEFNRQKKVREMMKQGKLKDVNDITEKRKLQIVEMEREKNN
ncbi:hypothetical protein [Natranaerobius trueperi]|nr:hypothetical protein [Natranaerobius trueperi]